MVNIRKLAIGAAVLGALYFGGKAIQNTYNWHSWDKNVTKYIEVANGAMGAAKEEGTVSMQESLDTAYENAKAWKDSNPAIVWKTPDSDVNTFMTLTKRASQRSSEIGQLETALRTGETSEDSAEWVKTTVNTLYTTEDDSPLLRRVAYSEQGQTIASAYEALNDVIAGGTRVSGQVETVDRSLVYTLGQAAGWRSVVRFEAGDYKTASGHVKVAVINANMGHLGEAMGHLEKAHASIEAYPDDKNLSIVRDVVTMNQGVLEKSILSAKVKLEEVDGTDSTLKYSAGWWDRVAKLGESVGGQNTPCLTDMSEMIGSRFATRAQWDLVLLLAFGALGAWSFYTLPEGESFNFRMPFRRRRGGSDDLLDPRFA